MFSYVCRANYASQSKVDSCENSFSQLIKSFNHFTNRFILPFQRKFGKKHSSEFDREIEQTNLPVLYDDIIARQSRELEQIRSTQADILNRDLEQIRETQEETQLQARGFKPSYYSGVDQAREFARVGEYIRNIKADPYTTHIPYYADRIDSLIRNVERGLRNGEKLDSTIERLRILGVFKKEAQKRIDNKKVTYEWWVLFHLRLFTLAMQYHFVKSKKEHYSDGKILMYYIRTHEGFRTHEGMKVFFNMMGKGYMELFTELMNGFPKDIMFFSTKDILGYMAFNRMRSGDHFIGISWKDEKKFADGFTYESVSSFMMHDIGHAGSNFRNERLIKQVEERINNISDVKKREKAELAWFIFRHERGYHSHNSIPYLEYDISTIRVSQSRIEEGREIFSGGSNESVIMKILRNNMRNMLMSRKHSFMIDYDLKEVLPDNINPKKPEQVEKFLKESANILSDILFTVLKHGQVF